MANQVHIVPHMHWDREWYFSADESKYLLLNNMDEIFEMLETNENYPCYILDGQTAILEDYFAYKPENRERFAALVKKGKLRIGPWYTQTDAMVVGGESIVRNLLYGHKDCKEFGQIMKIGYLPDSFGQSAQMPMILNGFDITRSMFWRGTSERMGTDKTEFYHESTDGSRVLCQLLPLGYAIGKYLPTEIEPLKERMSKYMPVLDKGATSDHILLPNGHDQMPIQQNIFDVMTSLKQIYPQRHFFLSDYESVFEELESHDHYATLKGEFLDGKYMRVHRSIFSSRADIKSANTRLEFKITNILEPLASMAHHLGFDYFSGAIEKIWKEMMKNHAHDSIGCCCSDKVHREILNRFLLTEEKVDRMIDFYKRKIVDAMSKDISLDKLTAFNLLPYSRKEVIRGEIITRMKSFQLMDENGQKVDFSILNKEIVDAGLIDRQIVHYGNYDPFVRYEIELKDELPAMGFKTYFIVASDATLDLNVQEAQNLENKYYKIEIHDNGTLKVYDKEAKRVYDQVLLVEDGSDDGDGYDYSPLKDDWILTSQDVKAKTEIKHYPYSQHAKISYRLNVPADLEERKQHQTNGCVDFTFDIDLKQDSKILDINVTVNNQAKDHRIRIYLPQTLSSSKTLADHQFGSIKRDVRDWAIDVWQEEKWSERPDAIYPMLSYVKLENDRLAFLTNSIREYEAIDEKTLALTLFRSTGYLGKEDLLRRPGRPSGIKMPTPDQQMLGLQSYHFAFACVENNEVAVVAKEYLTPITTYNKMPYNAMKLNESPIKVPYQFSFFSVDHQSFILSTFKKAEDKEGYILRGYNPLEKSIDVKIEIDHYTMDEVQLDEETVVAKDIDHLTVKPNQVRSVYVK